MDNKTIGIASALLGLVTFFYSFSPNAVQQSNLYFWFGIVMFVGGLLWAKYARD